MQNYINQVYNNKHLDPQKKMLIEHGYMVYTIREGCLLDDELWIHQDTIDAIANNTHNPKYIFIFKEKYLNEWSSTQTMRRYKQLANKYYEIVGL